jgi:hypothetical protein
MPDAKPHPPSGTAVVPEALTPWWRLPIVFWPLLIGVILLVGGVFGARPAWRGIKQYRAGKILEAGELLLAEDKPGQAIEKGRLALQLAPTSTRAYRLMAESLTRGGSRAALDFWQRLLATPDATPADRESFVELALQDNLLTLASGELDRLEAAPAPSPRTRLLGVRFHLLRNEPEIALTLARELLRSDPTNPTNQLALAGILQSRSDPASHLEARNLLWQTASNSPPRRIDAWENLVRGPAASREDRERIVAQLEALPSLGTRERILLAEARMLLDPSQSRAVAVATLPALAPDNDVERLAVALWLHRHRLFDLSLPFLAPNHVRNKAPLFRARIDALVGSLRMQAAYRELLESGDTLDPLESELLRLRAAQALKDDEAVGRHREQLLRAAGRDPARLRRVAEFAERNRFTDLAVDAWKRLIDDRYLGPRALRSLAALADQAGDTWAARDYTRRSAKLVPETPRLRLQLAHYDLLLGDDPARALETLEPLIQDPEIGTDARIVAALARLRAGDLERAWTSIQGVVYTNGLTPIPLRVIVAAAGSAGLTNRAVELARALPLTQLRPEERDLIRPYLILPLIRPLMLVPDTQSTNSTAGAANALPLFPLPLPLPSATPDGPLSLTRLGLPTRSGFQSPRPPPCAGGSQCHELTPSYSHDASHLRSPTRRRRRRRHPRPLPDPARRRPGPRAQNQTRDG